MNVAQVQFRIVGDDDRIPSLGDLLDRVVDDAVKKGQRQVGRESPHHFLSLRLAVGNADQEMANEEVTKWLRRHQALLASLAGDKWVEFSTALLPEQAYETLAFSQEVLRAAADAECRLHNTCYAVWPRHDSMWKRHVGE
jgi:hypothetical protein